MNRILFTNCYHFTFAPPSHVCVYISAIFKRTSVIMETLYTSVFQCTAMRYMCLLSTLNMPNVTEDLNCKFYLILINLL